MSGDSVKEMTSKFGKLEKFQGNDFRRWQKKMHFLLTTLKVVYVLSTPQPEVIENETLEQARRRGKWENDDYICRGHILNGMSDSLFDIYQNVESARELWDSLESKYIAEDASSKKFLVSDFNNYKMTDSRPVMEQYNELLRILGQFTLHKMNMDESIAVSSVIDKLPPSWKDFKHTLKHQNEELSLVQLGSHLRIEESLRVQENDKGKGKSDVGQPSVHMVEDNKKKDNNNKGNGKKRKYDGPDKSNKKSKELVCWRCHKVGHMKRDCRVKLDNNDTGTSGSGQGGSSAQGPPKGQIIHNLYYSALNNVSLIPEISYVQEDKNDSWWLDSCATSHVCNDERWFEKMEPMSDGSFLRMADEGVKPILGNGVVNLLFTSGKTITLCDVLYVPKVRKNLVSSGLLNRLGYKQVIDSDKYVLSKSVGFAMCIYCIPRMKHWKSLIYKTEVELQLGMSIKCLRTDRGGEYIDPHYFQPVGIIHETTAPYTPQQNGVAERKNQVLKEMVNSMLSYSGLSKGFWGEAMLTACYFLNRVPNKRNKTVPYELWYKQRPNLNYLRVWGCRAVVRLPEPKKHNLGEKGIDCIFIGYAENSKAYRFYVIEPNELVSVNTVIESRDAIFDELRFSSIKRPKDLTPKNYEDNSEILEGVMEQEPQPVRKSSRDEVGMKYPYSCQIEDDPKTFKHAMESRDVAFWKEAIDDEMSSILENNTWVLSDLPPGSKPLGCKWIFKKNMKVDGTIDKFKARLVIQGFKQKPGIDYFDTYATVARISTIRLLIALSAIHDLIVHQMDVKTAFLNGDLEEEVYMNQPEGFVMPGNEHKVCKLVKSLYGLKQTPKQWHQKFDEVILSSGFSLNQSDKCIYSRFDSSCSGVIICLYVDDMLIFGTDQQQVDETKDLLSSKFSMKDMGEADVILGIRIKRADKGIAITQSHYIEKMLKRFNYSECSPVSTPMDSSVKLMLNKGMGISQLEYSQVVGSLMYAMTSTRPDIAYDVGQLSKYTSNPGTQHWQAVQRVFKYLKGTVNYGLSYSAYPSVLEGYSDASWISNKDHSSTSGWVFLLGGGAISWASKKQSCITDSTMESEFVALAAAGKEAEWLRNLIYEIPLWKKPIAPISIHCDSATTLARAYSQVYNGNLFIPIHILTETYYKESIKDSCVDEFDYVKSSLRPRASSFAFLDSRSISLLFGKASSPYSSTREQSSLRLSIYQVAHKFTPSGEGSVESKARHLDLWFMFHLLSFLEEADQL
ncbi:zinc finger, CCHC-type [Artemisia annua]|uniref:Zinc finger, CCHC-type n=1 Tax=Artemisia annua TaxID=35608 RepID=A0A2U1PVD2_ARTAN|nr:zinc finger, CCHC-type [Artemisia annua]